MTPHFPTDSLSTPSAAQNRQAQKRPCRCCVAREKAIALTLFDTLPAWCGPLTPGVQAVNLSADPALGTLWVNLGNDWPRMLHQLPALGPGLLMSRNEAAILGCRQSYPTLYFTSPQTKAANAEAGLWLDCRNFGSARALHTRREYANVFGVEFTDTNGRITHRFSLTPDSDLEEFCGWVRLHQACPAQPASAIEEAQMSTSGGELDDAQISDPGAVLAVINGCLQRKLPLRATVFAHAVRQRATFVPRSLQCADGWWFASDDATGLHFRSELFSRVGVSPILGQEFHVAPVVHAETDDDAPALILELGDPVRATEWNALVHELI